MVSDLLREDLLKKIDQLPEEGVREVVDFAGYLLYVKKGKKDYMEIKPQTDEDPILKIIGIAEVEPFASKIDEELYKVEG